MGAIGVLTDAIGDSWKQWEFIPIADDPRIQAEMVILGEYIAENRAEVVELFKNRAEH